MHPHETPSAGNEEPALASLLHELLNCTELNMDDLEEHRRAVIQKVREVLALHPVA